MMFFYAPQGPFVLLAIGIFMGLTSGLAFAATFRRLAAAWLRTEARDPAALRSLPEVWLPFIGMASGACAFLGASLQVFSFTPKWAFLCSVPVTVGGTLAVWWQFGIVLRQIQRGGVAAIDLSSLE
ncbi:MAG: hypothetical protein MH825_15240 [Cyanobacteria bacterium]|nr:hypothetical protein [Cyanobacteriota bacterium]